ncbi:MAG TPA: ubiquinone/menaquinone biosynthesis methyltransferase [Vicinamibacterales bacterium]
MTRTAPPPRLRDAIATPAGKAAYVRRLFATIADRYDLITVVLSFGLDQRWKRRLVRLAAPGPSDRVLDLACGTGDIARLAAARGADVVGLDLVPRMIEKARHRDPGRRTKLLAGDMLALPFPDAAFDLVTTGYGLRNVPDLDRALAEIRRILRPGGRVVSLDFTRPRPPVLWAVCRLYLSAVGGALGWLLHRDPDTYRYIPESLRTFPRADELVERLRRHGFVDVEWRRVLGGLLAIHVARTSRSAEARSADPIRPDRT